jgi:cysteinyl-tRNA synthetase
LFVIYDTLTKRVEAVRSGRGGLLRMYSCGPARCGRPDLGELRSGLLADLIRRNAEHRHRLVAQTCEGLSDIVPASGGGADLDAFRADCSALNLRPAEASPRASESTGPITGLISRLIEGGFAYPAPGGSVIFDAMSYPGYGDLCGQDAAGEGAGRETADQDAAGQDPARQGETPPHWALWTGAAGDEHALPSPWGAGFPARSTQCAALSVHNLGEVIEVHAGGTERCVHHEHERAVSDAAAGHAVVRQWVHGERLRFEGAAPGDGPRVPDLTGRGLDPLALRLALLGHHYRKPLDLTAAALDEADRRLREWRGLVAQWACSPSQAMPKPVSSEINAAFDADLDTPAALGVVARLAGDPEVAPGAKFELFAHADQLLGLDLAREVGRV